jgi:hypothetical protein
VLVQGLDPASDAFAVGRALRISDQGPAVVYALPWAGFGRRGSRRQYDLDVPALKRANAVDALFQKFDAALRETGYLAMSGQIIDATIVVAPKQRNTNDEKKARTHSRELEEPAEEARPEGPRRALDGQWRAGMSCNS